MKHLTLEDNCERKIEIDFNYFSDKIIRKIMSKILISGIKWGVKLQKTFKINKIHNIEYHQRLFRIFDRKYLYSIYVYYGEPKERTTWMSTGKVVYPIYTYERDQYSFRLKSEEECKKIIDAVNHLDHVIETQPKDKEKEKIKTNNDKIDFPHGL